MKYTILSCSLDETSRSRTLAIMSKAIIEGFGSPAQLIDMREWNLPAFDNAEIYSNPAFAHIYAAIDKADGVLIAAPIYNWSISSVAKNVIESTGATGENGRRAAWFDKVVTFLCSGGLPHSYMAYGSLAMSLMLDFKCVINPYSVYATDRDWSEQGELSEQLATRLHKTVDVQMQLAGALSQRRYSSGWEV
jgi:NAD(P)H-dependent FMN reductase